MVRSSVGGLESAAPPSGSCSGRESSSGISTTAIVTIPRPAPQGGAVGSAAAAELLLGLLHQRPRFLQLGLIGREVLGGERLVGRGEGSRRLVEELLRCRARGVGWRGGRGGRGARRGPRRPVATAAGARRRRGRERRGAR